MARKREILLRRDCGHSTSAENRRSFSPSNATKPGRGRHVSPTPSRNFRKALNAYRNHIERRRAMVQVRDLDDHMLRQFGLSRVQLMAM